MSVLVITRFATDNPAAAIDNVLANLDRAVATTSKGKEMGQIGHLTVLGKGEVAAFDEWPTAEAFHKFMDAQRSQINAITSSAGANPAPTSIEVFEIAEGTPSFWRGRP